MYRQHCSDFGGNSRGRSPTPFVRRGVYHPAFRAVIILFCALLFCGALFGAAAADSGDISVKISGSSYIINGQLYTFTADVTPEDVDVTLTWESQNLDVASVDQMGHITGNSVGETIITVTATKLADGSSASDSINVEVFNFVSGFTPNPENVIIVQSEGDDTSRNDTGLLYETLNQGFISKEPTDAIISVPTAFDLRDVAGTNYVSGVRNQDDWGVCWMFANVAAAESNLIMNGYAVPSVDLSELQELYYGVHLDDVTKGQNKDPSLKGLWEKSGRGGSLNAGGNDYIAEGTLMAGIGLVDEELVPYNKRSDSMSLVDHPDYATGHNRYEVVETIELNNINSLNPGKEIQTSEGREQLKKLIMTYGAGSVSLYVGTNGSQIQTEGASKTLYNSTPNSPDHGVTVVGWNDNFPKDYFSSKPSGLKPSNNGAWLIKNSWSSTWGENGYFWVSYEDMTLSGGHFAVAVPADENQYIYQYDEKSGGYGYLEYNIPLTGSSSFIADVDGAYTARTGKLTAVSFRTHSSDYDYRISIDVKDKDGNQKQEAMTLGHYQYAGYRHVILDNPVDIGENDKITVTVTISNTSQPSIGICPDTSSATGVVYQIKAYIEGSSSPATHNISIDENLPSPVANNISISKQKAVKGAAVYVSFKNTYDSGYWIKSLTVKGADTITVDDSGLFVMPDADVVVTADYTANTYTVSVTPSTGGTLSVNKTSANVGDEITVTATPASGYKLTKLTYTPADGSAQDITETLKFNMPAADVTVDAVFTANRYTVTAPRTITGGSVTVDPSTVSTEGVHKDTSVTITATPSSGYKFVKWTCDKSLPFTDEGTNPATFAMPAEDLVFTPEFAKLTTTVTFDGNGATSGSMTSQIFKYGEAQALTTNAFERTNFGFLGWAESSGATIPAYTDGQSVTFTSSVDETKTLYAVWGPLCTVTFDKNGGSTEAEPSTINEIVGSNYVLPTKNPTKSGSAFAGWYTEETAGTKVTTSTLVENTEAHTLYAHWTENTFTITTVVPEGHGTITASPSPAAEGVTVTITPEAETGYQLSSLTVETSSGTTVPVAEDNTFTMPSLNVTVTAVFEKKDSFTVTYYGNGANSGTVPSDSLSPYFSGDSVTVCGNTGALEKYGYTFDNWNTKEDGTGTFYQMGDIFTITADTKLYAHWKINEETATPINGTATFVNGETVPVDSEYPVRVKVVAVEGVDSPVTFRAASNASKPSATPGFNLVMLYTMFEITAITTVDTSIIIDIEKTAGNGDNLQYDFLRHGTGSVWDNTHIPGTPIAGADPGFQRMKFPIISCSPFAVVYEMPIKKGNSSGSSDESSVWLTETMTPTVTPTPTSTPAIEEPRVKPTEMSAATQTSTSPAPFIGIITGLGAAAILFSLRRK